MSGVTLATDYGRLDALCATLAELVGVAARQASSSSETVASLEFALVNITIAREQINLAAEALEQEHALDAAHAYARNPDR